MKNSFSFLAVLLSANYLLAQPQSSFNQSAEKKLETQDYKLEEIKNQSIESRLQITGYRKITLPLEDHSSQKVEPTTNTNNQGDNLNCYIMMYLIAEKGKKAVEEFVSAQNSFKIFKDHNAAAKGYGTAQTGVGVSSRPTSTSLRLSSPIYAGETKHTSSIGSSYVATKKTRESVSPPSQHLSSMADTFSSSIEGSETHQEKDEKTSDVHKYLENEIVDNIYTKCLAKVATMTLNQLNNQKNLFGETAEQLEEWQVAQTLAVIGVQKAERVFTKVQTELEEIEEAMYKTTNKDSLAQANVSYQVKKLEKRFIKAQVHTARATRTAVEVRNIPETRTLAEQDLKEAQEDEKQAFAVYQEVKEQFDKGEISSNNTTLYPNTGEATVGKKARENLVLEQFALKEKENIIALEKEKLEKEKASLSEREAALAKEKKALEDSLKSHSAQFRQDLEEKLKTLEEKQAILAQEKDALDQKMILLKIAEEDVNKTKDDLSNREIELKAKEEAFQQEKNNAMQAIESDKNKLAQERNDITTKETALQASQEALAKEIIDVEAQRKALAQQQKTLDEEKKAALAQAKQELDLQIAKLIDQQKKLAAQEENLKKKETDLANQKTDLEHIKQTLDLKGANLAHREKELAEEKDNIAQEKVNLENRQKALDEIWQQKEADLDIREKKLAEQIENLEKKMKAFSQKTAENLNDREDNTITTEEEAYLDYIERAREAERAEWTWQGWTLAEIDRIADDIKTSWIDWEPTRTAAGQLSYRFLYGAGIQTATVIQYTMPKVVNVGKVVVSHLATNAIEAGRVMWTTWNKPVEGQAHPEKMAAIQNNALPQQQKALNKQCQQQEVELKQFSLKIKAMKDASSDSFEQWELEQSIDRLNEAIEYLGDVTRTTSLGTSESTALVLWREAVARSKESAEQYVASAQAWIKGTKTEAYRLDTVAGLLLVQAKHAKYLAKATENEASGNRELAEKWHEVERKNEQAKEPLTQSSKAHAVGKTDEGKSWKSIGLGFYGVAVKLGEAIEAEVAGKSEAARKYREAAEQQAHSVEHFTQSVRAYKEGKSVEGLNWYNAGNSLYNAEKLERAIKAEVANKPEVAQKWREVAEQQKLSIEPFVKAAKAYEQGKIKEGLMWSCVGIVYQNSAEKLEQAIKAENDGKLEIAKKWCEAAAQQVCSVEYYIQAAKAYEHGKTNEGVCWNNAALGFNVVAEKLRKAIKAENDGKLEIAKKWREVAEQQVCSVEPYVQAAKAYEQGKTNEGVCGNNIGQGFYNSAEKLEQAIEAELDKNLALVQKYREAAEQYKRSVEPYTQSVRAYATGKTNEGLCWNNAGNSFYNGAIKLGQAIDADIASKTEVAQKYREAAEQYKCSVEPYIQGARAYSKENSDEGAAWSNVGNSFYNAVVKLEKAIKVEVAGKAEVAKKYREAAEQQIRSAEPYTQAAKAYEHGKTNEGACWNNASQGFYNSAIMLEKVIEAEIADKPAVALKWHEVAEQYKRSIEPYTEAAKACGQENTNIVNSWSNIGQSFYNSALMLRRAIEVEMADKPAMALKCDEVVKQYKCSGESYTQAVKAYEQGKTDVGDSWDNVGRGFYNSAVMLGQAIEAEMKSKLVVAQKYLEIAEQYKCSVEPYSQAVEAYEQGKTSEGASWYNAGNGFSNAAVKLKKAIDTDTVSDT